MKTFDNNNKIVNGVLSDSYRSFYVVLSGYKHSPVRRVVLLLALILTLGIGNAWGAWYLRGVDGNWNAIEANKMKEGTNNIVWMSHATNSGYTSFKITNGTDYTTQYGQNSGNAVFGSPYLMKKDGGNAYTDNWSAGTYHYYFNTSTLYLTVYNTIEVKGTLMTSGWGNTTGMTIQSDGSWKQICNATLTGGSNYEFKIHANGNLTGYSSAVSCTNGTVSSGSDGNIKVTPTHGGKAVVVFHPEAGGTINVYCPYQVSYAAGTGASGTVSASAVTTYGSTCTLSSSTFTKTGYTQDGWATSNGGAKAYDLGATYTGDYTDVTLYPHWTAKTYTITLKGNGGSGNTESVTATYNSSTLTSITNPTRDGYTFAGWYTGTGGTGSMVIDASGKFVYVSGYTNSSKQWTRT